MLRKSPRITMAAPTGALSPATAHGYLPQYGGSAAASLAPSLSYTAATSPAYNSPGPTSRSGPPLPTLVENRPLSHLPNFQNVSSAHTLLKKGKGKEKETFDPSSSPDTEGIGPVYDGSDW
jgi:hypothetical protein